MGRIIETFKHMFAWGIILVIMLLATDAGTRILKILGAVALIGVGAGIYHLLT